MTQLWAAPTEQGFAYRQHGVRDQVLLDFGGLGLVTRFRRPPRQGAGVAK